MLEESRDSSRGLAKPAKGAAWKTVEDKNKLSKEICDDFCYIMKTISTKATQIDISKEGHGLSGSFVNGEDLTQEEMEEAINTWIEIEDDEDIQNAEMEEEMKKLEQSSEEDEEDVEPEEDDPMQLEGHEKVDGGGEMDIQTAESHLQGLEQYGESIGLDEAYLRKLGHFSVALREKKMEKVTLQPSLKSFFKN